MVLCGCWENLKENKREWAIWTSVMFGCCENVTENKRKWAIWTFVLFGCCENVNENELGCRENAGKLRWISL